MFKLLQTMWTAVFYSPRLTDNAPICKNCIHCKAKEGMREIAPICMRDAETTRNLATGWPMIEGNIYICEEERYPKLWNFFACGESGVYFEAVEESK